MRQTQVGFSPKKIKALLNEFSKLQQSVLAKHIAPPKPLNTPKLLSILKKFRQLEDDVRNSGQLINIWRLSGIGRDEVKNSSVLAWLLDSRGSHSVGADVLNAFLSILKDRYKEDFSLPFPVKPESYFVSTEAYQLNDTESRIDISIDSKEFTLFIEVKIGAAEGENQLQRYLALAEKKAEMFKHDRHAVIFLTARLDTPASVQSPGLMKAEWRDIAQAILKVVAERDAPHNKIVSNVLGQFSQHIEHF